MEKQQIEELIDKKILEAKLIQAEANVVQADKRLHFALWFGGAILALFGVLVPLWQINTSTEKVDKAIQEMEKRFNELAGIQLRKPNVECLIDGKNLENQILSFIIDKAQSQKLQLKNIGDAAARNIKVRLYINTDKGIEVMGYYRWESLSSSDEKNYSKAFQLLESLPSLDPEETLPFDIEIHTYQGEEISAPALFQILYEEPKSKKIPFTIKVSKK